MLQRLSATLVFMLLASCQATASLDDSREQWRWCVEQAQAELQGQLQSLSALVGARGMASLSVATPALDSMVMPMESAGTTELIARLATLTQRIEQLTAAMSTADATRPVDAVHGGAPLAVDAVDAATLEPLKQALLVLEQQHALHCQNIANVNVQGYKKHQLVVTSEPHAESGLLLPRAGRVVLVMTTGTLDITERSLDVAIDGEGFFVVRDQDGAECYTRCGSLHLNAAGQLVTDSGAALVPAVTVPNDTLEICIDPDGRISGRTASHPDASTPFGHVQLARFLDAGLLQPSQGGLLVAGAEAGGAIVGAPGCRGLGVLKQGFVERSNVQIIDELVSLQLVERQVVAVRRVLAGYGVYTR